MTAPTCAWCGEDGELKDSGAEGLWVDGPDEPLYLDYGLVCPDCWDDIKTQWEQNGELSKPLSAFAGETA